MSKKAFKTPMRKDEHIEICLNVKDVVYSSLTNGLENVVLKPSSLPELDPSDIELETKLFGKKLQAPIIISGMTGGSKEGKKINETIAEVCNELGIAMGIGSQRAAIENPSLIDTYIVRPLAPDIPIFANLGLAQFINGFGVEEAVKAIEMIEADAIAIHVNPMQELVQKEGDKNFKNSKPILKDLVKNLSYPIMVKGVGTGLSVSDARFLASLDVDLIDVAGAGGTNWTKIEVIRHPELRKYLSTKFIEWGIPTYESILNMKNARKDNKQLIVGSGGIWTGMEAVKALILGADLIAFALPALRTLYSDGPEGLKKFITIYINEMKMIMSLIGCKNLKELHKYNNAAVTPDRDT